MDSFSRQNLESLIAKAREVTSGTFRMPITKIQRLSRMDKGVRGPRWVSRATFPAPQEDDIRSMLVDAIKILGDGQEDYPLPEVAPVPVQWVGVRSGVAKDAPEPPNMTEQAKYEALVAERSSDLTLITNGPALRRPTAGALCKLTGAQSVIVQPRLAPQCPFPAQLLDVLHVYFSLLYPPAGSFHAPVDPQKLVVVADSSGSQLALDIVQVILATQDLQPTRRFHGRSVPLVLPAGVALQSPAVGGCLPSWDDNAPYDILPVDVPYQKPDFPQCAAWPTTPPREDPYTNLPNYMNPLVGPMTAERWHGAPPLYIAIGSKEMQQDPVRVVAQTAARQDVPVLWDEYELMPHNWPMMMPGWPQSERCMQNWARACVRFTTPGSPVATSGSLLAFEPDANGHRASSAVDVRRLTDITLDDVKRGMAQGIVDTQTRARDFMKKAKSKL
nr:hypothetical protein CFP56_48821 [Quercus suber]